jgi:hypothetical protein
MVQQCSPADAEARRRSRSFADEVDESTSGLRRSNGL